MLRAPTPSRAEVNEENEQLGAQLSAIRPPQWTAWEATDQLSGLILDRLDDPADLRIHQRAFPPPAAAVAERRFRLLSVLVWLGIAAHDPVAVVADGLGTVSVGVRAFVTADV